MPLTDGDLLTAIQRGDDSAFVELVNRYRPKLLRFAVRATGNAELAEDLVQDAFTAVHSASASYDPRFAVSTWIWTILLNLCRRHRRGERSRERVHQAWAAGAAARRQQDAAIDDLVRDDEARRLRERLAALPLPQADALRLRFFAELSFDEIAAAMNSSVSGAKARVRKGLAALSEQLRREESGQTPQAAPISSEDDET
jgi:RNA polymerase sigma-70 factor (ECF subfamily)